MDPYSQQRFQARLEWEPRGVRRAADRGDTVVVVDVLSFSTTVCAAVERGVRVVPVAPGPGAAELASRLGAVLASRRGEGEPSLSPLSFERVATGSTVVLPSPNGSACTAAADAASDVFIACLRNATAVAKAAVATGSAVTVVAAGERWGDGTLRPAVEDLVGAGAVLNSLPGEISPEALAAIAAFLAVRESLPAFLRDCGSGVELHARGFGKDVEFASALDVSTAVPRLVDGAIEGT